MANKSIRLILAALAHEKTTSELMLYLFYGFRYATGLRFDQKLYSQILAIPKTLLFLKMTTPPRTLRHDSYVPVELLE